MPVRSPRRPQLRVTSTGSRSSHLPGTRYLRTRATFPAKRFQLHATWERREAQSFKETPILPTTIPLRTCWLQCAEEECGGRSLRPDHSNVGAAALSRQCSVWRVQCACMYFYTMSLTRRQVPCMCVQTAHVFVYLK